MKANRHVVSRNIAIIIIFISLATIFGCKWGSWSFDLFGGDPVNGDGGGSGDGDNGDGDDISVDFPTTIFSATINGTRSNEPVKLYSSFENGSDITTLTDVVNQEGAGDIFKMSPDGTLVAYLMEEDNGRVDLFVLPVEGGTETRISELPSVDADVVEFDWSPNGSRLAYLADGEIDGRLELYTNLAGGFSSSNLKVSGSLPTGGKVEAFEWSPDSSSLAYTADQNNFDEIELFVTPANEQDPILVSETFLPNNGDVTDFSWSPGSSRIAYLSNQRIAGLFELFTNLPTGDENVRISGGDNVLDFAWAPDEADEILAYSTARIIFTAPPDGGSSTQTTPDLIIGGQISNFDWAPNGSKIAYRADQRIDGVIELFTVETDGSDNLRVSGSLAAGGNVTDFVWSPDSRFIAYRADQDSANPFELYVTTPDESSNDTKVSEISTIGDVEPIFEWSPDNARVAYRADQRFGGVIELFTSTPDGLENDRVSGDLSSGGNVSEFKWAPDSSGIGYIADQDNNQVFEFFASTPNGDESAKLSGSVDEVDDVLFFEWVP